MTAHELARQLLAGPDLPVVAEVHCDDDAVTGPRLVAVHPGSYAPDRVYVCRDGQWRDSQNPEPTHVFVEGKSDREFQAEEFDDEFELDDAEPT